MASGISRWWHRIAVCVLALGFGLCVFGCGNDSSAQDAVVEQEAPKRTRMVLIGDSRTCAMYDALYGADSYDLSETDEEGNVWSAKVGVGLSWMRDVGVPRVEDSIGPDTAVVILMGVNDAIDGAPAWERYLEYINEKTSEWVERGASVYYVSVGPVGSGPDDDAYEGGLAPITNSGTISDWNDAMRSGLTSDCTYLDAYSMLMQDFSSDDGLHYDSATNRRLYEFVKENVL